MALSQFRLGVLPIKCNMHRYDNNPSSKNCPLCDSMLVDDNHFLLICPFYSDLRARFIGDLSNVSVRAVMSWYDPKKSLSAAKFIFHAFNRRQAHLEACPAQLAN